MWSVIGFVGFQQKSGQTLNCGWYGIAEVLLKTFCLDIAYETAAYDGKLYDKEHISIHTAYRVTQQHNIPDIQCLQAAASYLSMIRLETNHIVSNFDF